jgi:hypothetical protein
MFLSTYFDSTLGNTTSTLGERPAGAIDRPRHALLRVPVLHGRREPQVVEAVGRVEALQHACGGPAARVRQHSLALAEP